MHDVKIRVHRGAAILDRPTVLLGAVGAVLVAALGGCEPSSRPGQPGAGGGDSARVAGGAVEAWVTTGDLSRLLAPDVPIAWDRDSSSASSAAATRIDVHADSAYQTMLGFGAAITDASAWLISTRMSEAGRDSLLRDLYGPEPGAGFDVARITVGSSDFSRTHETLADAPPGVRDTALARFSLDRDRAHLLPVVKQALAVNPRLAIIASPWSAPAWMKTSGSLLGGTLRRDAYASFAEYLARFVEGYEREGVPVFAITVQNEPHHEPKDYPGMRLSPPQRAELLARHVGPFFERRGIRARVLEWDHNWDEPESPLAVLADPAARRFVGGVAWHCYAGDVAAQSRVHDAHPDVDAYFTECSGGEWATNWGDNLRWNVRTLVVGATRNWARTVLLWNLALDERGGPHLGGCGNCRGIVTIDSATGAVSRNVEYYALAHASRFVRPGARRIGSTSGIDSVETVAFRNAADGSTVMIAVSAAATDRPLVVRAGGRSFRHVLPTGAVATYRWR